MRVLADAAAGEDCVSEADVVTGEFLVRDGGAWDCGEEVVESEGGVVEGVVVVLGEVDEGGLVVLAQGWLGFIPSCFEFAESVNVASCGFQGFIEEQLKRAFGF